MKFIDSSEIFVRSGAGGSGLVSFHSCHNQPKAGADGGDGGDGGCVYLVGDKGINTLACLKYKKTYKAEAGTPGGPNGRTGKRGEDCLIRVPLGTVAVRTDTNRQVAEISEDGQKILIAQGGKHGLGNMRFLRSNHQAPEEYTAGTDGEEFGLEMELKLIADVGFTGFPNAGKSTLLSVISGAKPRIADYPFTTLTPQLGVVTVAANDPSDDRSFVAADIPGLIEGASQGKGLGHDFLKHIERTKVIAFILDGFTNPLTCWEQYLSLKAELISFDQSMSHKRFHIFINKKELLDKEAQNEAIAPFEEEGLEVSLISAATSQGLSELKETLWNLCDFKIQRESPESFADAGLPKLEDFLLYERSLS